MNKPGDYFTIEGLAGKKILSGEIRVNGAKNAALKALASSLLFKDSVIFKNVPDIEDVARTVEIMKSAGSIIERRKNKTIVCRQPAMLKYKLDSELSKKLRASIVLAGPLLARTGKVHFPHPGGCVIGARPIDLFIEGFEKMGCDVTHKDGIYRIVAQGGKLKGAELFFRQQSVTATETFMLAAVLAKGKTVIKNAALEPEIKHLADFLNVCGARIIGAGTPTIEIYGGRLLRAGGKSYTTPPDRIEAGSFIILGALAARDLKITHCNTEELDALLEVLELSGLSFDKTKDTIHIKNNKEENNKFKNIDMIKTHEYPGFPTDLQAPMTVFLTQAEGECLVFETIFEGRLNYTEELARIGAGIRMMDPHRVIVDGARSLRGGELESPDLRAGLAFVIAAIVAKGRSIIHNVYNIDRGYERIVERLRGIGVDITRISL